MMPRPRPTSSRPDQCPEALVVRLEPGAVATGLAALTDAFDRVRDGTATIDLRDIERLDAAELGALGAALHAARDAGIEVRCAAVAPTVYKALHLAKLATLVTRVNAPRSTEEGSR